MYHSYFGVFLASEHTLGALIRNRTAKSLVIFDTLFEHERNFLNVVHECMKVIKDFIFYQIPIINLRNFNLKINMFVQKKM